LCNKFLEIIADVNIIYRKNAMLRIGERMYSALVGNGAACRLVMLPREGHHYRYLLLSAAK